MSDFPKHRGRCYRGCHAAGSGEKQLAVDVIVGVMGRIFQNIDLKVGVMSGSGGG